jgi:hypothetical protein
LTNLRGGSIKLTNQNGESAIKTVFCSQTIQFKKAERKRRKEGKTKATATAAEANEGVERLETNIQVQ